MVWARATDASRVVIEYSTRPSFAQPTRVIAPPASAETDFTTRVELTGLPAGQRIAYRVRFEPLDRGRPAPDPVAGSFRTPPAGRGGVSFVWGGDVAGQGWGIDAARGGYRIFDAMRRVSPDLFIHSGDSIYADNPILPEVKLDDGTVLAERGDAGEGTRGGDPRRTSAATTATTCSTDHCARSRPRSRGSCSGTTTRS